MAMHIVDTLNADITALRRAQKIVHAFWSAEHDTSRKRQYSITGKQLENVITDREHRLDALPASEKKPHEHGRNCEGWREGSLDCRLRFSPEYD
jgi:hypothetical protein